MAGFDPKRTFRTGKIYCTSAADFSSEADEDGLLLGVGPRSLKILSKIKNLDLKCALE